MPAQKIVFDGTYVTVGNTTIDVRGWTLMRLRSHVGRMKAGDTLTITARTDQGLPEGIYPY